MIDLNSIQRVLNLTKSPELLEDLLQIYLQLLNMYSALSIQGAITIARIDFNATSELVTAFLKLVNIFIFSEGFKCALKCRGLVYFDGLGKETEDVRI